MIMVNLYWEQAQQILFHDPAHAWVFVSLLYILATLFFQYVLTNSVKSASKRISSKNLKSLESKYLFRSIFGWLVYLSSWGLFLLFWYAYYFHTLELENSAIGIGVGSLFVFLLSVNFHLSAYSVSCLDQIKAIEDTHLTA
jgi:hypothetical protein